MRVHHRVGFWSKSDFGEGDYVMDGVVWKTIAVGDYIGLWRGTMRG